MCAQGRIVTGASALALLTEKPGRCAEARVREQAAGTLYDGVSVVLSSASTLLYIQVNVASVWECPAVLAASRHYLTGVAESQQYDNQAAQFNWDNPASVQVSLRSHVEGARASCVCKRLTSPACAPRYLQ